MNVLRRILLARAILPNMAAFGNVSGARRLGREQI
jgi:hypothetical protein